MGMDNLPPVGNAPTPQDKPVVAAVLQDLERLAPTAPHSAPIRSVTVGGHLVALEVDTPLGVRLGLASRVDSQRHTAGSVATQPAPALAGRCALELARHLAAPRSLPELGITDPLFCSTLAVAAVNALLPPPPTACALKGQELILSQGKGRRVAVVGHFPFVERLAHDFAAFWVLEQHPRPGDLPARLSAELLPQADVAAITGTSLANGTLPRLLGLCRPDCFVILLGPSTPFAPSLFELGVDALAGAVVRDRDAVLDGVGKGLPFKAMPGLESVVWLP